MAFRRYLPLATLLVLTACSDVASPPNEQEMASPELSLVAGGPTPNEDVHFLRQSPTAPPLETYQVSFWARRGRASTITVNYLPQAGRSSRHGQWGHSDESGGRPFLRFDIPRDGLKSIPGDERPGKNDAVLITLTIHPKKFYVDFQPSGVTFDKNHPASLVIWYGNADRDLNADGVIDAADEELASQLALWTRQARPGVWHKMPSGIDPSEPFVSTTVRHFSEYGLLWSEYAVSW